MAGWAASCIAEIPTVRDGDPGDPVWHPLQHAFGLTAFGANVFVAAAGHETLVARHDETASGQQELYIVLEGEAEFDLDGDRVHAPRGTAVAVTDPAVRRCAVARARGTAVLAIGASGGRFSSTWLRSHFERVPRVAGSRPPSAG